MENNSNQPIDELVLVVHGVGDPQPGQTLSLFARSVAESHHPLTEHQEMLWLADENEDDRDVHTFATHVRHLDFDGGKATLAEVYWGDLSRVSRGTLGILRGLIEIVFGLRYVAFVAAHQSSLATRALQGLGLISSRVLHGPVLAVNFVLFAMMMTVVVTEMLWQDSSRTIAWANTLVMACVLICLVASFLGWRVTRNIMFHRFWFWVMVASVFMAGLMLANAFSGNEFSLLRYCRVLVVLLGAQWLTLMLILASMFACWCAAMFNGKNYRPALNVALVLPAIAIGIWGQALPLVWVMGARTLDRTIPIPERFYEIFQEAVPLLGFQFVMSLFLAGILIFNLARFFRASEKMTVEQFQAGRRAPRLIVNNSVQLVAGKFAVIGVLLVIYLVLIELQLHGAQGGWLATVLSEANKYAIAAIVPIGLLLFLSMHYLRSGLDIILDVVNHFYFRPATPADREINIDEEFDIVDVTFDGGQMYFARRDSIHRRMKRILEYYRKTLSGNPTLTIVSHSQGSMIAIEVINDNELAWVNEKFSKVNFITMGSPFHHIYQQYFMHLYPALDDKFLGELARPSFTVAQHFSVSTIMLAQTLIFRNRCLKLRLDNTAIIRFSDAGINIIGATDRCWT